MYIPLIVMLVIGIALFIIAFKVIKLVFKVILFACGILLIAVVIFGFFVVSDIKDIKDNFNSQSSIILVEEDGEYVDGRIHFPDSEDRDIENTSRYNNMTKEEIADGHYKLIIFKPKDVEYEGKLRMLEEPLTVIKSYKEGDVEIYPQLKTVRLIKSLPTKTVSRIFESV